MDEGLDTLCNPLSGEEEELVRELSQLPRRLLKLLPHLAIGITAAVMTGTAWASLLGVATLGVATLVAYIKVRSKK
jgi:hypothetical protein